MPLIDPYIIRIKSAKNSGTGFILPVPHEDAWIYVVTATHVICEEGQIPVKKEIHLTFDGPSATYTLNTSDEIYRGEDQKTEDVAIIRIPVDQVPPGFLPGDHAFLMDSDLLIKIESSVSGYGALTFQEAIRTFDSCRLLTDSDYVNEMQLQLNDPIKDQYNDDVLIEGYSGSPIYALAADRLYIAGIFEGYDPITKRISAISVELINIILERATLPLFDIKKPEFDTQKLQDIEKLAVNTKRILSRINDQIGQFHLDRPDVEESLNKKILTEKLTVVFGKPGIGKSALVKKVINALSGVSTIGLQGEQLDRSSIREVFKSASIGIQTDIDGILSSTGLSPVKVILIDSIEKLLETTNAETIIDFFSLIKERSDIRLVLTCRSYAVEQLKIRFLKQFEVFNEIEVPRLSDQELRIVGEKYPFLDRLMANSSLKHILQIPFNLDKASMVQKEAFNTIVNSESDFKRLMWDYVIEAKDHETDPAVRKRRGIVFTEIAYQRACAMTPYAHFDSDPEIVYELEKDQLIELDIAMAARYAPSHDIYEDWALTRRIELQFVENELSADIFDFFLTIGTAPAVRRAFRIWIAEKLQLIDFNIKELIFKTLKEAKVEQYWKDEILIAIMQSDYSDDFLKDNKDFLFEDGFALFKRSALLLQVACQSPDMAYLKVLEDDQKNYIYLSHYLKPYGEGWPNMIRFIEANLNELSSQFSLILKLVFQWEKSLNNTEPPDEAASAARIVVAYFKYAHSRSKDDEDDFELIDRNETASAIHLLLQLAALIPEEIEEMLRESLRNDKRRGYHNQNFWENFNQNILSWEHSPHICRLFPDLVLHLAEKEWFYYAPTAEELDERYSGSPFRHFPREIDTEEKFGVVSRNHYRYSPASAWQTPAWHLLRFSPAKTVDFILRLFDHSVRAFFDSDFLQRENSIWQSDERNIFQFEVNGTVKDLYGSQLLWAMYRGKYNITSPYLLQSVLMALEKWLLDQAEIIQKDKANEFPKMKANFEAAFNHLLTESRSVSIFAVLISVATAHPTLCKNLVGPLLNFRMFYKWDLIRCSHEWHQRLMGYDDSKLIRFERNTSDEMPHRKDHMETLIGKLSFTDKRTEILALLDKFYAENPDDKWKLALNRMDIRKLEVIEETDEGYKLMPKIDEDLRPMVQEAERKEEELLPVRIAGDWVLKKWDGKELEDGSYSVWQNHYRSTATANPAEKNIRLFRQIGALAAVGIRDFFDELSEDEYMWCVKNIFAIAEHEIRTSGRYSALDEEDDFGALDPDHALAVLVPLIAKAIEPELSKAKELLVASLLFVHNELHIEKVNTSVQAQLWQIDQKFAFDCVAGLVEYAKISNLRMRISHFRPGLRSYGHAALKSSRLELWLFNLKVKLRRAVDNIPFIARRRIKADEALADQWTDQYNNGVTTIIDNVVSGEIKLNFEIAPNLKFSPYHLFTALKIIPFNLDIPEVSTYYDFLISYLLSHVMKDRRNQPDEIHYKLQQEFSQYFACYLLQQNPENALSFFKRFTTWWEANGEKPSPYYYNDKRLELIKTVMKEMLWYTHREGDAPGALWAIWEHVFNHLSQNNRYFNSLLLLNDGITRYENWKGIKGRKSFYEKVIEELGDIDETVLLLQGQGFEELMPEGIRWYAALLEKNELKGNNPIYMTEKLIIRVYYDKKLRTTVKSNGTLRQCFISILDKLINLSSSAAFLIREDFMSLNSYQHP